MRTQEEFFEIESSQKQWHETLRHSSDISYYVEKEEYNLFVMLKPKLYIDGNQYCVLFGENIQDGICGFGDTAYKAILDFNKSWNTPLNKDK